MNNEEKLRNKLTEVHEADLELGRAESKVVAAKKNLKKAKREAARTINAVYGFGQSILFKQRIYCPETNTKGDLELKITASDTRVLSE